MPRKKITPTIGVASIRRDNGGDREERARARANTRGAETRGEKSSIIVGRASAKDSPAITSSWKSRNVTRNRDIMWVGVEETRRWQRTTNIIAARGDGTRRDATRRDSTRRDAARRGAHVSPPRYDVSISFFLFFYRHAATSASAFFPFPSGSSSRSSFYPPPRVRHSRAV